MNIASKDELAKVIISIGAIKFGSFKLKLHENNPGAPLSPIYIDLRLLRSYPRAMRLTADIYKNIAKGMQYSILSDIPTASTPLTAVLSYILKVPMISPRIDKKEHGLIVPIDGSFSKGDIVLVIDDLITKADSKLDVISILESNGLVIHDLIVLIDREQGGVQVLKTKGYSCHCAFKLTELLSFYHNNSLISENDYNRTLAYLNNL
jgi:uridine monophosphate synthetase